MLLNDLLKPSRIYPVVLLLLMIIVWKYRSYNPSESNQETKTNMIVLKGNTMGTYYDIRYIDSSNTNLQSEIDTIFRHFLLETSTWIEESEISRFNLHDTLSNYSDHLATLLAISKLIHDETAGAFDPTVGPLVNAWGFGEKYDGETPDGKKVDSLLQFVGYEKIYISNNSKFIKKPTGTYLNLSAIAKGYGGDIIGDFLSKKGIENFKVEIGGEVVCKGTNEGRKWRIGIEKPSETTQEVHTVVEIENEAMATSGNYRNYFEKNGTKYAHTINPKTGQPIQLEVLSASVVASNCMVADAYATAFMVMGLEVIKKFCANRTDINVFIIYEQAGTQKVWMSEGMRKRIVI